jgi:hypothetical protein
MAYNPYDPNNQGIGTLDLGNFGLQKPEENMTVAEAINYGMLPQAQNKFQPDFGGMLDPTSVLEKGYTGITRGDFVNALESGAFRAGGKQMFDRNVGDIFEGVNLDKSGLGWNVSPTFTGTTDGTFRGNIDIDKGALSEEALESLPGGFFKSIEDDQTSLDLPANDKYAMAISNYDQLFGPKTMTDAFGTTHTLGAVPKPDLYTGDLMAKTGQRLRDPFAPLENQMVGPNPHDLSVYDPYGNIQMALEDQDFYENPKGLAQLFQNFNIDPSSWGKALKTKAKTGWNFAQQLPGMALGALTGLPGIGAILGNMARPDSPYQKFQKQMFSDMGYRGDPNKDPWGKNIRSLADNYDVRDQWSDLAGSVIGQKYGYNKGAFADAMADGVITAAEKQSLNDLGLRGWQLDRVTGLAKAKAKADAYHDKINAALALKEKQKEDRKKGITYSGPQTYNYNPNIQKTGPTYGPHQKSSNAWSGGGNWGPGGKSPSSKGSSSRGHHSRAKGGRVGYANGGLATLFSRRG